MLQVEYGLLLSCFAVDGESHCLVQVFEQLQCGLQPLINEFNCPLLTATTIIMRIASLAVISSISVAHECSTSCTFQQVHNVFPVERENVDIEGLQYVHDWNNNLFCLNVHCMNL